MRIESHRLFIGNLPDKVSQSEIEEKFKEYGSVESVEIKTKQAFSGEITTRFCFVNLYTDQVSSLNAVRKLNGSKWNGENIIVAIAKESFLARLQRERQAAASVTTCQQPLITSHDVKTPEPLLKPLAKKWPVNKKQSSSSESSDSEDEDIVNKFLPTLHKSPASGAQTVQFKSKNGMLQRIESGASMKRGPLHHHDSGDILKKFETFSSVWKDEGEISEDEVSSAHVKNRQKVFEENVKTNSKPVTHCMKAAEEKRLKSIEERRLVFEQQKRAVQSALSNKKGLQFNKKVVFDDDDDDDLNVSNNLESVESEPHKSKAEAVRSEVKDGKSVSLFENSESEADEDEFSPNFQVKKQFQGEKGRKLLELQSRFNNDSRFKIDERFYESDEENEGYVSNKTQSNLNDDFDGVEGLAKEREQQFRILSDILGRTVPASVPTNNNKINGMLRFDPLKSNHSQFKLSKEPKPTKAKPKPKPTPTKRKTVEEEEEEAELEEEFNARNRRQEKAPEEVSTERYFSVSDSLTETFKRAKEEAPAGFSLLKLFDSSDNRPATKKGLDSIPAAEEKKKPVFNRPDMVLDSSSDEEDQDDAMEGPTAREDWNQSVGLVTTGGVWQENFFFNPDDVRLTEGASFIVPQSTSEEYARYCNKRSMLRTVAHARISKNRKKANEFKAKVSQVQKIQLWKTLSSKKGSKDVWRKKHERIRKKY